MRAELRAIRAPVTEAAGRVMGALRVPLPHHIWRHLVLFALAYFVGALLGQWPTLSPGLTATLWIPSGLTLAAFLLAERSYWPHFAAVAFLVDLAVEFGIYSFTFSAAMAVATGNLLEPLVGASLVQWWCGRPFRLHGVRNVLALTVLAAIVGPTISATFGAVTLHLTGAEHFSSAWLLWWLGDAIGVLILAPLTIALAQHREVIWHPTASRLLEAAILVTSLIYSAHLFFSGSLPFAFVILPFLLWAALRFGVLGAAIALAILAAMTFAYVTAGFEPFAAPELTPYRRTILVQSFLGIVSVSILLLAALIEQLNTTLADLGRLTDTLEERVRTKTAELRASEARVRGIIDNQLAFVGQLTTDGTLTEINRAALTVCALSRAEVEGKKFWDCHWAAHDSATQDRLRTAISRAARGEVVRFDETFRVANDASLIVDFMVAPVRDAEDRITHIIPSGVDITERKRAEVALAENEERLRLALESAGAADWAWDVKGDRLSWSERYRTLYGFRQDEPGNFDTWIERVHPDDRARLKRRVEQMMSSSDDNIWDEEFRILHPERGVVRLGGTAVMKRDADGSPLRMTGINIDITDRHNSEFQLRLHEAAQSRLARMGALGEFAAGMAHEINQPLMAARTYIKLAVESLAESSPSSEAGKAAGKALEQVERAADVVRRLREFIQFGRTSRAPTNVFGILRTAVKLVMPEIERANIVVREDIERGLPPVLADSLQIEQVLINLLRNAIEAMTDGSTPDASLSIRVALAEPGIIEFCVRDTGPGFPRDHPLNAPQLFLSSKQDGLGFGLPFSRSIVEAHGGRLWIDKRTYGAAVHFTLPVAMEQSS